MDNKEKLSGQTNVENETDTKENSSKHTVEEIEKTPFLLINSDQGYFIAIGNNRLSAVYNTPEEALKTIDEEKWHYVFQIAMIITERWHEFEKFKKNDVTSNSL